MEYLLGLIAGLTIATLVLLLPDTDKHIDTDPEGEVRK
jgi:hypothetical protein